MYIIIAIIIFGFLITTHELGHFTAAKLCGVRVTEFAVGMGPLLLKKQGEETQYSLRLLPIGGFCAMDEDEESEDSRAFINQKWWKRFIILAAGAAMNFLTGIIILLIIVPGARYFSTPTIVEFQEGCPYESAEGLMVGDTIHSVDGNRVYFPANFSFLMTRNHSDNHDIVVIRDGEEVKLKDYHMPKVEYEINGETVERYGITTGVKETGISADIKYSWNGAMDFVRMVWMGLSDLVSGAVGLRELSGPVGIVGIISDVGESSATATDAVYNIAYLAALIAVNLAVMNLLPIPALDGGRILFLLVSAFVECITKKRLNPKYEGYVHAAGLVLLLGLMAVVMFNDIYKIVA